MNVLACLWLDDPVFADRLGPAAVARLVLDRLEQVRGPSRVLVCHTRALAAEAAVLCPGYARLAVPDDASPAHWLDANAPPADALLVVRPATAFVAAATVEACLLAVAGGADCAATCVAHAGLVAGPDGVRWRDLAAEVFGVRAFRRGKTWPGPLWAAGRFQPVLVGPRDALDVTDADGWAMAEAVS